MTLLKLARQSGAYHWRTNLAVMFGVAAAVSVLGGALLVGDSVRGSLRDLALGRLGKADVAVSSAGFFREAAADDLRAAAPGTSTAPLIIGTSFVTHEPSGRRAGTVIVYGVDERFWSFHGVTPPEGPAVSAALAAELGANPGDVLLVRLQRPSEIPIESLFGRKEEIGRTVRLTLSTVLPRERLGEFSLRQQQSELRAVFAPLRRIQRDLGVEGKANTIVVAGADEGTIATAAKRAFSLDDLGVNVRAAADGTSVIIDSSSGILSEPAETSIRATAQTLGLTPIPVFTYLANSLRHGDREVPYSLITALPLEHITREHVATAHVERPHAARPPVGPEHVERPHAARPPVAREHIAPRTSHVIYLNSWAQRELSATAGDEVSIDYYLWDANAGLTTRTQVFRVAGIVPIAGLAADRQLAPEYPGLTGAESVAEWDPPFPLDLAKVRPQDEKYWDDYRTTPKAFIAYEQGRDLWRTRYGAATSLRLAVPGGTNAAELVPRVTAALRSALETSTLGIVVQPVRLQALEASAGATDFGQYFAYFSFFIVVSALTLAVLFFRLGVEQRLRQIGVLRASGFSIAKVRLLLLVEAMALAGIGSALGALGALGYGRLIVYGLRTWWIGAVGTTALTLHVAPASLAAGVLGGTAAAALCVFVSLRAVGKLAPRALLTAQSIGQDSASDERIGRRNRRIAIACAVLCVVAVGAGYLMREAQAGAFFGAGAASLIGSLYYLSSWLRLRPARVITGRGTGPVLRLGFRSPAFRPGRTVLSAALIASAAFIIVSVDAFRKGDGDVSGDRRSGTGGFALIADSELPLLYDPNETAGREALIVQASEFDRARFTRFRLRPGDDASCLNLYRPTNPTIVAPEAGFTEAGRFTFARSLAASDAERANPWILLQRPSGDGPVPVIADATSLQYVLHAKIGDTFSMDIGADQPLQLLFVAALADSVLQGQLVMSEENFVRLFPSQQGYRFFLIDAPDVQTREAATQLAGVLEKELATFGFDAVATAERLEAFHRVENTYLSTFQALGGLGLLLGTIGLAAVMFRNVLERRRELALLRAVGYDRGRVTQIIMAEALLVLGAGLCAGVLSAVLAVGPAWMGRGGTRPGASLLILLGGVVVAGVISSAVAARAALGGDVLSGLRAE
ncbi:MAG: ABC transporter permease [Acidobacteria bacterium]|nr:ABC transporter permease [Acidobacteriota bacterium]